MTDQIYPLNKRDQQQAPETVESLHTVLEPAETRVPFVFNSPHSGRRYSKAFVASSRLNAMTLRKSEDCYVDELFGSVVPLGAPLLKAEFPRAWLDVNREPWELDATMFAGELPAGMNTNSARVRGGLGTIAKIVSESEEIYSGPIPVSEAIQRIENHYMPYHATLRKLLARVVTTFGHAVLIDCHSMPSFKSGLFWPDTITLASGRHAS